MRQKPNPTSMAALIEQVQRSEISSIRSVVAGILRIINDPACGARDLREAIEIDPPLMARILKLANSAYYGVRVKILDITQAIIFVGFEAIKELALNQKVAGIFHTGDNSQQPLELWRHCVAVGLTAKLIYRREFRQAGDIAYAAGLLHDIGAIVLWQFAPEAYGEVEGIMETEKENLVAAETRIFGFDHALLGQAITSAWEFPVELSDAIGGHHHPHRISGDLPRLALTLFVADHCARRQGFGDSRNIQLETNRYNDSLRRLDLSRQAMDLIFNDVKIDIHRMQERGLLS